MAVPLTPRWEMIEIGRTPVDDGQILIVDRTNDADGRTVCIVLGRLARDAATGDFVRALDAEDASNARLIAMAPRMRDAITGLVQWASGLEGWTAAAWKEAQAVLGALDNTGETGDRQ